MRNKGFTLIELLAVIVILAIIALIATPIVLGIINDTRKSADQETAKLIVSHFETAYSTAYMQKGGVEPTLADVAAKFNMDGIDSTKTGIVGENGFTVTGGTNGEFYVTSKSGNVTCKTTTTTEGQVKHVAFACEIDGETAASLDNYVTVKATS